MSYFAKNILYLRKKNKYTQAEMPGLIAVGRATWSNYENGLTEPDFDKLIGIANFFKVSIDNLLTLDIGAAEDAGTTEKENNIVQEPESDYDTVKREQVNWLILQGISTIGENVVKIKEKLGI